MFTVIGLIILGYLIWCFLSELYDIQEETRAWHREDARKRRERMRNRRK